MRVRVWVGVRVPKPNPNPTPSPPLCCVCCFAALHTYRAHGLVAYTMHNELGRQCRCSNINNYENFAPNYYSNYNRDRNQKFYSRKNIYLSEKNNFEIVILTTFHSQEFVTQFSELRTVQPTLAKIHGRKLFASGSPHPGLAYCLNMNIVPRMHCEIVWVRVNSGTVMHTASDSTQQ